MSEDDEFQYKTYRCEWVAEVYPVDQYDRRLKEPPIYEKEFPTHSEAYEHLMDVTEKHPYVTGRRVYKTAPHEYYYTGVRYREVPSQPK